MKKLMIMAAAMGLAVASFAAQNDALLTFSTPGPDKYGDGTTVLDGECYALVWTATGSAFAGLKADGTPVAATDKLILLAPLAKNGACPQTLFQVDAATADALEGKGTYGVYLLDTRVKAEDGTTKLAAIKDGKPVAVNALATVAEATAASAAQATTMQLAATAVGGAAVTAQTLVAEPAITGIKVDGAKVTVTVAGMSPIATYQVVTGMTPGKVGTKLDAKSKGDTFEFAKPEGQFFKVIGTRNFK